MVKKAIRTPQTQNQIKGAIQNLQKVLDETKALIKQLSGEVSDHHELDKATAVDDSEFNGGFIPLAMKELVSGDDRQILMRLASDFELEIAMDRLITFRDTRYADSRPRYWAIVDFDRISSEERLFVFDVAQKEAKSYLCAHGRGSEGPHDDGLATVFSNVEGSNATSLGIYRCAETYEGSNGFSMRLDGLEQSNSRARSRDIVMHGAWYVSHDFIVRYGRIGRSEGCPALEQGLSKMVIDQLKNGSFLLHWYAP